MRPRRHIDALRRRLAWLEGRIAAAGDAARSFDCAEAAALRWVFHELDTAILEAWLASVRGCHTCSVAALCQRHVDEALMIAHTNANGGGKDAA